MRSLCFRILLAAGLVSCTPRCGAVARRDGPALPLTSVATTGSASASPSAAGKAPTLSLSEGEWLPLLLGEEWATVRAHLEEDAPLEAAKELDARLALHPELEAEPAWNYLRGSLWERAGEVVRARGFYERASGGRWALADLARVTVVRLLVEGSEWELAAARLGELGAVAPDLEEDERLLRARVAWERGARDEARGLWRGVCEARPDKGATAYLETLLAALPASPDLAREALEWARKVLVNPAASPALRKQARLWIERALMRLPVDERARLAVWRPEELLAVAGDLRADGKQAELETIWAEQAPAEQSTAWSESACGLARLVARGRIDDKKWTDAFALLDLVAKRCPGTDDRAWAHYLIGKYAFRLGQNALALQHLEQLEREQSQHSLADDARLLAALAHQAQGEEGRFTELLLAMPTDYPQGDMVEEGLFRLALRRMERNDRGGAASVLELGREWAKNHRSAFREDEQGRESYFLAKLRWQLGKKEDAISTWEEIVENRPFSYYMLQAYAQLKAVAEPRAKAAVERGRQRAEGESFRLSLTGWSESSDLRRGLELLRVGEWDRARAVLSRAAGGAAQGTPRDLPAELVWGIALAYERAGSSSLSLATVRRCEDWPSRWPAGAWQQAWRLAFPLPFEQSVGKAATQNDLPAEWIYSIMREESAFDPSAMSPVGAHGLMQLMLPTARTVAKGLGRSVSARNLLVPATNIELGSRYLGQLRRQWGENPYLAVPSYNAGPGAVKRWIGERPATDFDLWVEQIPYVETRRYTKRVLASLGAYVYLGHGEVLSLPLKARPE